MKLISKNFKLIIFVIIIAIIAMGFLVYKKHFSFSHFIPSLPLASKNLIIPLGEFNEKCIINPKCLDSFSKDWRVCDLEIMKKINCRYYDDYDLEPSIFKDVWWNQIKNNMNLYSCHSSNNRFTTFVPSDTIYLYIFNDNVIVFYDWEEFVRYYKPIIDTSEKALAYSRLAGFERKESANIKKVEGGFNLSNGIFYDSNKDVCYRGISSRNKSYERHYISLFISEKGVIDILEDKNIKKINCTWKMGN